MSSWRPERTPLERVDRAVQSMVPGSNRGRIAQAMPVRSRRVMHSPEEPLDSDIESVQKYHQDEYLLPETGEQVIRLMFEPQQNSEHVYLHGVEQPSTAWRRASGSTSITLIGDQWREGALVVVEYAYIHQYTPLERSKFVDAAIATGPYQYLRLEDEVLGMDWSGNGRDVGNPAHGGVELGLLRDVPGTSLRSPRSGVAGPYPPFSHAMMILPDPGATGWYALIHEYGSIYANSYMQWALRGGYPTLRWFWNDMAIASTYSVLDGAPHLIGFSVYPAAGGGLDIEIMQDGVVVNTAHAGGEGYRIGGRSLGYGYTDGYPTMPGLYDEVLTWNRRVTAEEWATLYEVWVEGEPTPRTLPPDFPPGVQKIPTWMIDGALDLADIDARIAEASIGDLADVDTSTPAETGQALVWNGAAFAPGDVAAGGGGGGSGGGSVSHDHNYVTSGNVTFASSTAFVNSSPVQDLVVSAKAGDVVLLTIDARLNSSAWFVLDLQTVVAGAVANSVTADGPPDTTKSYAGWALGSAASNYVVSATRTYTVQANDVENGTVTFRLRCRNGGSVTLIGADPGVYLAATVYGGGGGTTTKDRRWTVPSGWASLDEFTDESLDPAWVRVDGTGAPAANVTWREEAGVLSVEHTTTADATAGIHGLLRPIGAAMVAGDAFVTHVRNFSTYAANYHMAGLILSDGVTWGSGNQIAGLTYPTTSIAGLDGYAYAFTGWNTSGVYGRMVPLASTQLFLRLVMTAANTWRVDVSPDGVGWLKGATVSKTVTPTHVGFASSNWATATPGVGSFEFLRRVSGVI